MDKTNDQCKMSEATVCLHDHAITGYLPEPETGIGASGLTPVSRDRA